MKPDPDDIHLNKYHLLYMFEIFAILLQCISIKIGIFSYILKMHNLNRDIRFRKVRTIKKTFIVFT